MPDCAIKPRDLAALFEADTPALMLAHGARHETRDPALDRVCDAFEGADCLFLRSRVARPFALAGRYAVQRCAAGGWLLLNALATEPSYWFPTGATLRRLDAQGHILEDVPARLDRFTLDAAGVEAAFETPGAGASLDGVIWRVSDAGLLDDLQSLAPIETAGYFLLGSHTRYGRPADLYRHLIHGWVFEDRYAWPHKRRVCSENDAHALYLIFNGLQRATGKRLYGLLKTQLLLSVLSRQSEDGGFRHGEWTDAMESHYRLHCSALHLMMDALGEAHDPIVAAALERGIGFLADKHDTTSAGPWFYHDELETSEAGMRGGPFRWWPGRALGKSPQNMLVLNTHLDAVIALDRYARLTNDARCAALAASGTQAALAVLELRPMEWLYRLLFSAIDLTLLPTEEAARLPLWKRAWKRVGWKVFIPRLPRLKTRFPRLAMPGGYVDRELSLQTWAYDYLAVNLMDLVRAANRLDEAFLPFADGIVHHARRTGIARRWLEHKGRAYALAFHAEALVLLNQHTPRPDLDGALADALMLCVEAKLGLPPSLLGGNAESRPPSTPIPQPARTGLVVADLSHPGGGACLVVNASEHPCALSGALCEIPAGWRVPEIELGPGGWARVSP